MGKLDEFLRMYPPVLNSWRTNGHFYVGPWFAVVWHYLPVQYPSDTREILSVNSVKGDDDEQFA